MNTIRTFVNEPLVSTTQYSDQAVGNTSEESGSITGRSGRFFLSVMRPDTLRPHSTSSPKDPGCKPAGREGDHFPLIQSRC